MKDIKIFLRKKKKKKRRYDRECYKNLTEDEKQKLAEYRKKWKKIAEWEKTPSNFLSFLSKRFVTFIYNYYSEKESLKIRRKIGTVILCNSSNNVRIIHTNKYLIWLLFSLFVCFLVDLSLWHKYLCWVLFNLFVIVR